MAVSILSVFIGKKMLLIKAVFILIFVVAFCWNLFQICNKGLFIIKTILPDNEFSHLKGVNKQPYLDIRTCASGLTKRCLFSCYSLQYPEQSKNNSTSLQYQEQSKNNSTMINSSSLLILFNYLFYIHPVGHFRVVFCLYVKTNLSAKPFIGLSPAGSFSCQSNLFSYERVRIKTHFKTKAQGNIHPWAGS